jgi:hypothetical protein
MATFSDHKLKESSEKIVLCQVESSERLMGWVLHSGSVYKLENFDTGVVVEIAEAGVALTSVAAIGSIVAGSYFNDRVNQVVYLRTTGSVNPNSVFISLVRKNFYSNTGAKAPHDLASGDEVHWLPLVSDVSDFTTELDNQNQTGIAIEGSGTIKLLNDQDYWRSKFDKVFWENQRAFVYSWGRGLDPSEAKLIFRGRVVGKSWAPGGVSFSLKDVINELRQPLILSEMSAVAGARITDSEAKFKQRRVYGYNFGFRPLNIDQVLEGYPLTGTVAITNGSPIVTGTGTSFLTYLTKGDAVHFAGVEDEFTVQSVDSNTQVTLSDNYQGDALSGIAMTFEPELPSRHMNRVWFCAGHPVRKPEASVVSGLSLNIFEVDDPSDIIAGDEILVNGERAFVQRVAGNTIRVTTNLLSIPGSGDPVIRPSVNEVYLNNKKLILERDYTFNSTTAKLTLDPLAEFNIAPILTLTGSITMNSGSRSVTGVGTMFLSELAVNDWLRVSGNGDYFEVLSIESDTALTIRSAATYTDTDTPIAKRPKVFDHENDVLSCDILGRSSTNTTGGYLLKTVPDVVLDLLNDAGLSSIVNLSSFSDSKDLNSAPIGVVYPREVNDTKTEKIRDIISTLNKSVFGSLIQDNNFELTYNLLRPKRLASNLTLKEKDVLGFSVKADSSKIIKTAKVRYAFREYDRASGAFELFAEESYTSEIGSYLTKTKNEYILDSVLAFEADAAILASRLAFILETSSAVVSIKTKLQAVENQVNDTVIIAHEKLYERPGIAGRSKAAAIQKITKSSFDASLEIEDLSGAFTRCSTIAIDTSNDYLNANDSEKLVNGYITEDSGLIDNERETWGQHLIW